MIITGQIDPETGEMTSDELGALNAAAQAASEALLASEKAQQAYDKLKAEIEERMARAYPELEDLRKEASAKHIAYATHLETFRLAGIDAWKAMPGAGKTLLSGAITIAEVDRVTAYDAKAALDWCDEMGRSDLVKREADKTELTRLAKAKELPADVMKIETVIETRVKQDKLLALAAADTN